MKVTVTKYLNVRVGKPSVNAPCYQYLAPGSELEIDGQEYVGDVYNDNSVWYRDEANNYYWSGGLGRIITAKAAVFNEFTNSYSSTLINIGIPSIHQSGLTGKGVRVAILDTGINTSFFHEHIDFELSQRFIDSPLYESMSDFEDVDPESHGTKAAGIVSAPAVGGLYTSIAPEGKIVVLKIGMSKYKPIAKYIKSALRYCLETPEIQVVNFSYNSIFEGSPYVKWAVEFEALANSKIIVASGGNQATTQYPATFSSCIGVGRLVNESGNLEPSGNNKNLFYTEGINVPTISKEGRLIYASGTSFSAPIITGLVALKLQQIGIESESSRELILKSLSNATNPDFRKIDEASVQKIFQA